MMRWYPVPNYNPTKDKTVSPAKRPAQLLNAHGELVAECEKLEDAEHIADLHNNDLAAMPRNTYRVPA